MEQHLVCPIIHERRLCRPLTQKINRILDAANSVLTTWAEFTIELDKMFADPNCQATTRRKLATLCQGDSSVGELIQEFKIHGSTSGLGDIGLINHFEHTIHLQLCESIYCLKPMPTTWAEWKCKASLLDNQWRCFWDMQPKATANIRKCWVRGNRALRGPGGLKTPRGLKAQGAL